MADQNTTRIGFVTPISGNSPHFEPFKAFIPAHVEMEFEGLGIVRGPLESLRGTGDLVVETSVRLARERDWQGVIVSGAPVEVLNPGLLARLQDTLDVPVTTALESCVAALQALSASRVLLLTPFVESMNVLIRDYLGASGIAALSPSETFDDYKDAMSAEPEQVYTLTQRAFEAQSDVDAIYFQGAVLDPLKVLDRLENDLAKPIVASNPAMLWRILSQVGVTCSIPGHGQLLREWPATS
jgi:maleate isomerase